MIPSTSILTYRGYRHANRTSQAMILASMLARVILASMLARVTRMGADKNNHSCELVCASASSTELLSRSNGVDGSVMVEHLLHCNLLGGCSGESTLSLPIFGVTSPQELVKFLR
jgi:hypothetical protein